MMLLLKNAREVDVFKTLYDDINMGTTTTVESYYANSLLHEMVFCSFPTDVTYPGFITADSKKQQLSFDVQWTED